MIECRRVKHGSFLFRGRIFVLLNSIKEIRIGQNSKGFGKMRKRGLGDAQKDLSFSLIYGSKFEMLDLMCSTVQDFDRWTKELQLIIDNMGAGDPEHLFLRRAFEAADENQNGLLDVDELAKVWTKLAKYL